MTLRCGAATGDGSGPPCRNRVRGDWPCATHGGPTKEQAELLVRQQQSQSRADRHVDAQAELSRATRWASESNRASHRAGLEAQLQQERTQNRRLRQRLSGSEQQVETNAATIRRLRAENARLRRNVAYLESSQRLAASVQRRTAGRATRHLL